MATEYGARLRAARKHAGLTQQDLSKRTGIPQSTISTAERLGSGSAETVTYALACGVSPSWLATGEGEMLPSGLISTSSVGSRLTVANTEPGPGVRGRVPLISWVQAGAWCQPQDVLELEDVERWMLCMVPHSPGTFALRVRGDSMTAPHGNTRTYPEGCFIFVDPERRTPSNGDRVVACLSGTDEVTFKIYKSEDGRQWLQPLNPSHEPIREKFHILGAVIGKWEDE